MMWVKAWTRDYKDPFILSLSVEAQVMYHRLVLYCGDMENGGHFDSAALPLVTPGYSTRRANRLLKELQGIALICDEGDGQYALTRWELEQSSHQHQVKKARERASKPQAPKTLDALRAALSRAGFAVSWAYPSEGYAQIEAWVKRAGVDQMVAAVRKAWQADNPARSVAALIPVWEEAAKGWPAPWCGQCDKEYRWVEQNDGRVYPCPRCSPQHRKDDHAQATG